MAALRSNSGTAATTVATATSVAPALTLASLVGSFLVIIASTTNAAFTTPTNWTLLSTNTGQAGLITAIFIFPNNPGGITSVTVATTTGVGGIAAVIAEFTGTGITPVLDASGSTSANSTSVSGPAITSGIVNSEIELALFALGNVHVTTITPTLANMNQVGTASSTGAGTNCDVTFYYGFTSYNIKSSVTATLSATALNESSMALYIIIGTVFFPVTNVFGNEGGYIQNIQPVLLTGQVQ